MLCMYEVLLRSPDYKRNSTSSTCIQKTHRPATGAIQREKFVNYNLDNGMNSDKIIFHLHTAVFEDYIRAKIVTFLRVGGVKGNETCLTLLCQHSYLCIR